MPEEKREADDEREYHAPAIEEVVSREGLEREVAYAGIIGGSNGPPN